MPATLTYPGVYIEEISSGVRTIIGVATSITAFIGRALRGPTDDAVTINSYADFERKFGGLWVDSSLGYAVRDFYLNGGSQAIIVRLFRLSKADLDAAANAPQTAADAVAKAATDAVAAPGATKQTVATAAANAVDAAGAPGPAALAAAQAVSNAAAAAVAGAATPQAVADAAKAAVADAVAAAAVATATASAAAAVTLPGPDTDAAQKAADAVAKAATDAVAAPGATKQTVATAAANAVAAAGAPGPAALAAAQAVSNAAAAAVAGAATPQAVADAAKAAVADAVADAGAAGALTLVAANVGRWGRNLSATVDYKTKDATNTNLFNLTITETDPQTKNVINAEQFLNVSVDDNDPRYVPRVLKQSSALVRVKRNANNTDWDVPDARPLEVPTTTPVQATGGSDGDPITEVEFTGPGKEGAKQGLFALEKADLFNLLCIPPYTSDSNVDATLVGNATSYFENYKRRAMLLVDPRSEWTTKEAARDGVADVGTNSKNSALFFPRLKQPNPLRDKQLEDFAPCGAVAGIFARTDSERGVWKAPAGLSATLEGVPRLSVPLTDAENGELNPLGINCLRTMPAAGRIVWGSRTLQGNDRFASEWKYIPVRRTALFIEESLYRGTQWVVFEPNDEPLWAQIRLNVGAFMHGLFRQGAFQGQTPKDAYFVKCDKESTTQNDINSGVVNIIVGFAPLKPAEFVVISLQQMAGQIET